MSSERQRRAGGRLFQMTAPATAKLLIPSLGTNSDQVPADRRYRSLAIAETARQAREGERRGGRTAPNANSWIRPSRTSL